MEAHLRGCCGSASCIGMAAADAVQSSNCTTQQAYAQTGNLLGFCFAPGSCSSQRKRCQKNEDRKPKWSITVQYMQCPHACAVHCRYGRLAQACNTADLYICLVSEDMSMGLLAQSDGSRLAQCPGVQKALSHLLVCCIQNCSLHLSVYAIPICSACIRT